MGGSGRNGGGGGRVGILYNITSYTGEFRSNGGVGTLGENGAAGTVYLNNVQSQPERKLVIYNQGGSGVCVRRGQQRLGDISSSPSSLTVSLSVIHSISRTVVINVTEYVAQNYIFYHKIGKRMHVHVYIINYFM